MINVKAYSGDKVVGEKLMAVNVVAGESLLWTWSLTLLVNTNLPSVT